MSWYALALLSLLSYGLQNFLYKVSAELKFNTVWVNFCFMATVTVLGWSLVVYQGKSYNNLNLYMLLSFMNAVVFSTTIISRIEALKYLDTSVAYPILRMSIVIVVLYSVIFFGESLSAFQIIGIVLAIAVIFLVSSPDKKLDASKQSLSLIHI